MGPTCEPMRNGVPYIHWINVLFGDCVYGSQEATSVVLGNLFHFAHVREDFPIVRQRTFRANLHASCSLNSPYGSVCKIGYASILCWFNAQLPQIYENYKNGSVESLSLPFLVNWMLGMSLQRTTYLAIYFCIVDLILMSQWVFYTYMRPRSDIVVIHYEADEDEEQLPLIGDLSDGGLRNTYTFPKDKAEETHKRSTSMVFFALLFLTFNGIQSPQMTTESTMLVGDGFGLSKPSPQTIGRIMAWTCTVLYLTSRMPQIWKNWRRGSVEGLSIALFIFAASGNLTYTMSIFTNPNLNPQTMKAALPYILGSAGTLMFDVTIYIQWWYYTSLYKHGRRRGYEHFLEEAEAGDGVPMEVSRPPSLNVDMSVEEEEEAAEEEEYDQ
ncbi:PQ loop repeat-domain-containing protein [Endogone sp. FLAS-F59071]|nr:PQ loop repeat-domain-containing protein [Endogone sp. FLAS-F59071]|eukprot:RUS13320.1 PQ loop repeat-domain-containing protein [Endogone sp. FLAS-F59071]